MTITRARKFGIGGWKGEREKEASQGGGAKENSGDFRKRLHKRAHLNFSNSPAFHFPDGRSFVRRTRLLRALVSFAGYSRLTMAAAFRNVSRKVLPRRRSPPSSDIFNSFLYSLRPRGCLVRRRELSRCESDLKLSPYIRSVFLSVLPFSSGVVNRAGDLALALVVWSSPSSVPSLREEYTPQRRVVSLGFCFSNRNHFCILFSAANLFFATTIFQEL